MDDHEERIRVRAYEIWERQGRTGDPQDHWLEAEREIGGQESQDSSEDRPEATVQEASPVEAVEAQEAASNASARGRRSSAKASRG